MSDSLIVSEDDFWAIYKPIDNPRDGSAVWEYEDTLSISLYRVWSLIEGDEDSNQYAVPGYHIVNKFGYAVTEVPWVEGEVMQALWCDFEGDGEEAHRAGECCECGSDAHICQECPTFELED